MTDAELILTVESRKKSGWLAGFLNLFLPGFGYFYCGNWFLGLVAIGFIVMAFVVFGIFGFVAAGAFQIWFLIDGFLCASRYNKRMTAQVIQDNQAAKAA